MAGRDGAGERVMRAAGVAVGRRVCAGLGLRQAETMAVQELRLVVGKGGGGGHVVDGEEGVRERGSGVAEAGAGGGGEGGGWQEHGGEEVSEDGAGEGVLGAVAGDGVQESDMERRPEGAERRVWTAVSGERRGATSVKAACGRRRG